ncbi:MAG: hypothetical protein WAX04_14275 [Oscillospiraceae bacterium]
MSIIISNIRISLNDEDDIAFEIARKRLRITDSLIEKKYIYKKSLDARHKGNISFVVSVVIDLFKNENESEIVKAISDTFVTYKEKSVLEFVKGKDVLENPIIIAGFGPAGIFCAYTLSKLGYKTIVFERGGNIDSRVDAVNNFWTNAVLDEKTNVQFGEGGAGTFSDGKLTTRISDSRCDYVLGEFVNNGAPQDILQNTKPHIGTDKLRGVIKSMRKRIIDNGGKVYFNSQIADITIKNNAIYSVTVEDKEIRTDNVVLAIGHSARDTFEMLLNKGVAIESKSFSVGLRIEQLQSTIDTGLYGDLAGHEKLPQGEYQLSHRLRDHCVYTFCMCPGGFVVPSSSSPNSVVTNGMSEHARDGINANSAIVVSVDSNDFGDGPLAGMNFQQQLEQSAFTLGGQNYKAPAMTVKEFMLNENKLKINTVEPSYSLGVTSVDFNTIFSKNITDMLKIGLRNFDTKLKGFAKDDGILTGVETRTSSPIRIIRNDNFSSINIAGLYPCGEGAGYAGGIISAAVDGIKVAEKIISIYTPD